VTENIYWTIDATIKPGHLSGLKEHVALMVEMTATEPGALAYDFWLTEDETRLFIYERYADSEAAIAHLQNVGPHLGPFLDAVNMQPIVILGHLSPAAKEAFASFKATHTTFLAGLPA
jgi:quinol monooxygenase YgiN